MTNLEKSTWMPVLLDDETLRQSIRGEDAVAWMREAVVASSKDLFHSPPRLRADLGPGPLVVTAGALDGEWFGYRSYDGFDLDHEDQITVLHSAVTGRVLAIAVGAALGELRTGAVGGVAVDLLARPDARTMGVIGSGPQAWTQIWAASAVRTLSRVSVFSLDPASAEILVERVRTDLGIQCDFVTSAEEAVREHDVVVLATNSPRPVLEEGWVSPGTHVTTLGPKHHDRSEIGMDLLNRATVVATDSPQQLRAYSPPPLVLESTHADTVRSLGSVAAERSTGRTGSDDVSVYLSTGLAGSEVHLLYRAVERFGWGHGRAGSKSG